MKCLVTGRVTRLSICEQGQTLQGYQDNGTSQERDKTHDKNTRVPLDIVLLVVHFQDDKHSAEAYC